MITPASVPGVATCEIAIVGGGIVGTALALALIEAGLDVRVIERAAPVVPFDAARLDPRVYAISPASARFLDEVGVWSDVVATRAEPIRDMQVWDQDPQAALRFSAGDAGAPTLGWIVEHRLLAQRLWQRLPAPARLTGLAVEQVQFSDEAAQLGLSDGRVLTTRLAIGAEGAHSTLRDAAGIDAAGWTYGSTAVVCHLHSELPHRGTALQRFLPSGPLALLPLADGQRSLVWSTSDADAQELQRLDDDAFVGAIDHAMQGAAGRLHRPTARLSFPLRLLHATAYVAPRCALVGDSAHVIHPLAGQGLNLGLADARQLAHELRGARHAGRDWASSRVLARYERARQAENLDMLALTDTLGRVFGLDLPGLDRLLHVGLRAVDRLPPIKQLLAARASGA